MCCTQEDLEFINKGTLKKCRKGAIKSNRKQTKRKKDSIEANTNLSRVGYEQ
jgi:hypothetical protein